MTELGIMLKSGPVPLYEQIYEQIRCRIIGGELLSGERLPSTRSLASFLSVSRTTVEQAYEQLLSEGYIEARPQRGYDVCDIGTQRVLVEKNVRLPVPSATAVGGAKAGDAPDGGATVPADRKKSVEIDFSPRTIDMSSFPYATWKKITRQILVGENSAMFFKGDPQGDEALREIIARYLNLSRGVNCRAQQIIIGAGNDYLLMLLCQILGPRRVAMEAASYRRAAQILGRLGCEVTPVDMDEYGMSVQSLTESGCSLCYVMPAHQYPSGIVMPIGRRRELLRWADEDANGVSDGGAQTRYIIEDDYDSEFRYRGKPVPSLQASDSGGHVIYMGTFSKSVAPAIRVSFMVLPEQLLEVYHRECLCFSNTVSRIDQAILENFLSGGYFERYLSKMRRRYRIKHDLLLRELAELPEGYMVSGADAGLHVLISRGTAAEGKLTRSIWEALCREEEELIRAARKRGIELYSLHEELFWTGRDTDEGSRRSISCPQILMKPTWILGYASLSEDEIRKGTGILCELTKA